MTLKGSLEKKIANYVWAKDRRKRIRNKDILIRLNVLYQLLIWFWLEYVTEYVYVIKPDLPKNLATMDIKDISQLFGDDIRKY